MNMAELVIIMGHFALEYAQPVLPGKITSRRSHNLPILLNLISLLQCEPS